MEMKYINAWYSVKYWLTIFTFFYLIILVICLTVNAFIGNEIFREVNYKAIIFIVALNILRYAINWFVDKKTYELANKLDAEQKKEQ